MRQPLDKIRAEHFALRRSLDDLEDAFAAHDRLERSEQALARTLALLESLPRTLREHFAVEEEGGYFSEVVAAAPRLARTVKRLGAEHVRFRAASRELAELAGKAAGASEWDGVEARAAELLRALRAHEDRENAVVQDAFMTDMPRGD